MSKKGLLGSALVAAIVLACGQIRGQEAASKGQNPGSAARAIRVLLDSAPAQGCWLLLRNVEFPSGPGQWVQARQVEGKCIDSAGDAFHSEASPVILTGETITVEEDLSSLDARLRGVALEAARGGHILRVRLEVGGNVVKAVALAHGRASLVGVRGDWR